MRFFETQTIERIGYDFYCDISNNIVKARQSKKWTQKKLAEESGIKESLLSRIENVRVRIDLDVLEKLSKVLDVTVNWLIDAEIDSQVGDCLYVVWAEHVSDFKLYQKATSKRMAFLMFDKKLKEIGAGYNSRERFFVKLVGVPVTDKEIKDKFPKRTSEDLPLDPD